MNKRALFRILLLAFAPPLFLGAVPAGAQEKNEEAEKSGDPPETISHPVAVTANAYLRKVAEKDWPAAAEFIKPRALARQHHEYAMLARRAPTIDEEVRILERLGIERLRDLEKMTPTQFYIANREALERANRLTPAVIAKMKETFRADILGVVEEEPDRLTHVLVRTTHETLDTVITERILLSFEKDPASGKWLVAPEYQTMGVRPLITGELPEGLDLKKE